MSPIGPVYLELQKQGLKATYREFCIALRDLHFKTKDRKSPEMAEDELLPDHKYEESLEKQVSHYNRQTKK